MQVTWLDASASRRNLSLLVLFGLLSSVVLLWQLFPSNLSQSIYEQSSQLGHSIYDHSSNVGQSLGESLFGYQRHPQHGPYATYWLGPQWPGKAGIEHIFVFGDSWSITGFEPLEQQPSRENPLGNPEWPGATSTNGPCWVGYLTTTHNISFVKTINMAAGGATVDMDLIAPNVPHDTLRSLKTQIVEQFPVIYGSDFPAVGWKAINSLFIIWIGLNDVHNAEEETYHLFEPIFAEFADHLDILYRHGARNFFIMNLPPIHRAPLAEIINTTDTWRDWIGAWNQNLTKLATNLTESYLDTTTFIFDIYKLYDDVMNKPCILPESCGFEETTHFCPPYSFGTPEVDFHHENCTYSVDKYFWMNDLHPTTQTHNMTAHAIMNSMPM